jgi:cytochrome c-type biogenesis protein CcmH
MKHAWLFAVLLAIASSAFAIDSESFADPALHARYKKLTRELRCLQCQNETIADSNATLAVDLRRELRAMVLAGKSDAEIQRFMTDRYGDFVLYQPPFTARTVVLWVAPWAALLGAMAAVIVVIRRRTHLSATDSETEGTDSP